MSQERLQPTSAQQGDPTSAEQLQSNSSELTSTSAKQDASTSAEHAPTSAQQSNSTEEVPLTVDVRILSPSPGIPEQTRLGRIPTATTIGQLKEMIRDRLDSRPAARHQRLLYQARPLPPDQLTLQEVFGAEAV